MEDLSHARLIGLQGCLARPLWGGMGPLAVTCGVLASNHLQWDGQGLLTLALVLLLTSLGWGTLWNLVVAADWSRPLADGQPPGHRPAVPLLPYTLPDSPGGRLARRWKRFVAWWRQVVGPTHGLILAGLVTAVVLIVLLTAVLPARLRLLNAAAVALVALGGVQRWRGRVPLAAPALMHVGLGWLAGHGAFAGLEPVSWVMALAFALAAVGVLWAAGELGGGLWLVNVGQGSVIALLVSLQQPLAAGAVGLCLLGQIALQPALHFAGGQARAELGRRGWPWLIGAMLLAALAVP